MDRTNSNQQEGAVRFCFKRYLAVLAFTILAAAPAFAGLKDIHVERLPNDPAVRAAYDELLGLEDMVRLWQPQWRYETPKDEVITRVNAQLGKLQQAALSAPESEELLLLLGLAAHYSYNLDVQENYKVAVDALTKAQQLAPQDYRPAWFLGIHECLASELESGMERFLAVESSKTWEQLPASFWDDYIECASVANMPAHLLRAGNRANKLDPQGARDREFLIGTANKRFLKSDVAATYQAKEVWSGENSGDKVAFTSLLFGIRFVSPGDWKLNLPEVQNGFGMVQLEAGPYRGKSGKVVPNIMVLVRPPKNGETLQDFLQSAAKNEGGSPIAAPFCPAQECLAVSAVRSGSYKKEGDGHALVTVFQREEPEVPGLIFEQPMAPPVRKDGGVQYFHPNERLHRLPGTLYYLVMVDTASSVLDKAKSDYESFLKSMKVE